MFAFFPQGGHHHTPDPLISWDSDGDASGGGGGDWSFYGDRCGPLADR